MRGSKRVAARWAVVAAVATGAALLAPVATTAVADTATVAAGDEVDGAIYSPTPLEIGISLTVPTMETLAVDQSKIDTYQAGETPAENLPPTGTGPDPGPYPDPVFDEPEGAAAAKQGLASYPIYEILHRWKDKYGAANVVRRGYYNSATDQGFGNDKFYWKHNLTIAAVATTTRYPRIRYLVSGKKYNYETDVYRVKCSGLGPWRKCKVVDKKVVQVSHDFRIPSGSTEAFGVVTAFCIGVVKCPDWVKNALNV